MSKPRTRDAKAQAALATLYTVADVVDVLPALIIQHEDAYLSNVLIYLDVKLR